MDVIRTLYVDSSNATEHADKSFTLGIPGGLPKSMPVRPASLVPQALQAVQAPVAAVKSRADELWQFTMATYGAQGEVLYRL